MALVHFLFYKSVERSNGQIKGENLAGALFTVNNDHNFGDYTTDHWFYDVWSDTIKIKIPSSASFYQSIFLSCCCPHNLIIPFAKVCSYLCVSLSFNVLKLHLHIYKICINLIIALIKEIVNLTKSFYCSNFIS